MNDSPKRFSNCKPRAAYVRGRPKVMLFATKYIPAGTELRFDYGGHLPWRKVRDICLSVFNLLS